MLNNITKKIAEYFGESSEYGTNLKGSEIRRKAKEFLSYHSLSDLLPYESYDEEHGLFLGSNSIGFIFEIGLFVGSERKLENELAGLFGSILPEGSNIQFLLSAMPKVDHIIENWKVKGNEGSIIGKLEEKRAKYFEELSRRGKGEFRIRDFRGIISVSIPVREKGPVIRRKIAELKEQVRTAFETRSGEAHVFRPEDLISYLGDILNYNGGGKRSVGEWNPYNEIKYQIIDKDKQYGLTADSITMDEGEYEMRFLSVKRYPGAWGFGLMNNLIGDQYNDYLKIPCSFLIHFGVHIEDGKFKKTGMLAKASRVESQASSPLGNWIPALKREAEEWGFVREQLEKNERLVRTGMQIVLIDKAESIGSSEQIVNSLYRANGWELKRDKFVLMLSLKSILPLSWGEDMAVDMSYLKKLRTTLSHEPVNTMPLQGESKGCSTPGMLLAGRRGQLCYWYPFNEELGNSNYNVSVVGMSGKGKSVFMQDMARSIVSKGGRVFVIDVGRSFERQVKHFEGQFVEFKSGSNLCLNPFSNINSKKQDDIDDQLAILKPIIAMMIAPKAGTTDHEDSLISEAITRVWNEKGNEAGMGDIADWFLEKEEGEEYKRMGRQLFNYGRDGVYGKYFNGKANINFDSNFFVTELGDLKSKADLQKVVLQILIMVITQKVALGDRKQNTAVIFDEAWDMLKGKQGGEFVEYSARTLRKYKASLVTGTQNISDFYSSPGAEAAFMNTDWLCCLAQKSEAIALLKNSERFKINESQQRQLESIDTKPGEYAEVMIMVAGGGFIGRLILEPFSRVLYSTKAEEYEEVKRYESEGMKLEEAVEKVAKERYGDG
jgi:conjugal transfer ATP-binding protein TraC